MDVWGHGRQQDFFQGWAMRGSEERKSPAGFRGSSPVVVWGRSPEADDIFSK